MPALGKNLKIIDKDICGSLAENIDAAIILLQNENIIDCNNITFDYFGKSLEEIQGVSIYEFLTVIQNTANNHTNLLREYIEKSYETGVQSFEITLRRADGSELYSETTIRKTIADEISYLLLIIHDITTRIKALDALKESEKKYRALIEDSNDAIVLVCDGKVELVNSKCIDLFGLSKSDLLDTELNVIDFVAPKSKFLIKRYTALLERGLNISFRFEVTVLTKAGVEFEIEASVARISYNNGSAVQCILRDIKERKKLEAQLRQSQKMEAVGRLAGGVAHDFNNLLTAIIGHSELAKMNLSAADPMWKNIDEILKEARRAVNLTRQLLAFSRKQTLEPKIIDLNSTIVDIDKMLRRIIGEHITLMSIPAPDLWRNKVDPGQIEQVIVNLVINARDAMPEGGELIIETANVELDMEFVKRHPGSAPGQNVMLAVSDTGHGIPKEHLSQIFEPFFTTKREGKGTGLGLATVYGIVKQSGGYISVYSEVNVGTTFKLYFPRKLGMVEKVEKKDKIIDMPRGNETIIVVEDEQSVRSLTVQVLSRQGYYVYEARSGADAYQMCKKIERDLDLVITDVVMPIMGGEELVQNLRKIWPNIKAIFMSGYTENAFKYRSKKNFTIDYLPKPFTPSSLAQKVRKVLDQ